MSHLPLVKISGRSDIVWTFDREEIRGYVLFQDKKKERQTELERDVEQIERGRFHVQSFWGWEPLMNHLSTWSNIFSSFVVGSFQVYN